MRILLINQNWFQDELRESGHDVKSLGFCHGPDTVLNLTLLHIDSALQNSFPGWQPDVIVWHDNSAPVAFVGLEETDVPTIFYSVDAQHHIDVHKNTAHMFDYTLVAQKEYIKDFESHGIFPEWMPLWAPRYVEASKEKQHEVTFVGNMDQKLNPERVDFFTKLKERVPLFITQGQYWNIFPFSEIVINQSVKGELNFRTFEAMMCGTLLLTEESSSNGLFELFKEGEHLATYRRGNIDYAVEKIQQLLSSKEKMRKIAETGREEILKAHTARHRTNQLLQVISRVKKRVNPYRYTGAMINFNVMSISLSRQNTFLETKAQLSALTAAEKALEAGEKITDSQAYHLVTVCLRYDMNVNSRAGSDLISRYADAHPNNLVILCAKLRELLRAGRMDDAKELAHIISPDDERVVFAKADEAITEILAMSDNNAGLKVGESPR